MSAYYNEHDHFAASWLRQLIDAGHIAPGVVDERSIEDVLPDDLAGFTQCHFFAGIGGWSFALRQAGWPDDKPVWTGSCPCQPFSTAGKGAGVSDERHLWPAFHHLIDQCRPGVIFGEQVGSKDGLIWLDLVHADMEGTGYAFGAADLCAAGFGAPHIRQRLFFVADTDGTGQRARRKGQQTVGYGQTAESDRGPGGMDNNNNTGLEGLGRGHQAESGRLGEVRPVAATGESSGLADTSRNRRTDGPAFDGSGSQVHGTSAEIERTWDRGASSDTRPTSPADGFWRDADWLYCRDGKWRPVESGTFPLAHGIPKELGRVRAILEGMGFAAKEIRRMLGRPRNLLALASKSRIGRLRGYGNAIVPGLAAEFIRAYLGVD